MLLGVCPGRLRTLRLNDGLFELALLQATDDGLLELIEVRRLGQVVEYADLHRFHRRGERAVAGEDDRYRLRIQPPSLSYEIEARRVGLHTHVGDDQIEAGVS